MPAGKNLHDYLDLIFDSGQTGFTEATEAMLRAMLRGAVSSQHLKRFPEMAEEAVRYMLLARETPSQPEGAGELFERGYKLAHGHKRPGSV